ncbi:hypothetical protein CHLNCDRAFT_58448 [Chlorella variabilis]|uniref:Cationic amino acid transporter C-terminal domain-containing protein n=1 Tax=Chlorella variabilis TaxID=554065 RepID=E1ZKC1_CHLVA|nr:hypothetical protein CHLNCDRAFT_58448 [Chlorella variabilis]EFN53780.1 hypothetical protein CHLNCDRAFT_58448 [Chlorella variabilis]|eukprot:XP_005845882.1 hypothetical protein CHLNCDRAFT_58448 [Chlorella variabilis]
MKLVKEYFAALRALPTILPRLVFRKRTLEEQLQEAMLRGSLRKAFGGFDVLCLGLGILIGSGWAQFTGTAGVYAGTAVIISVIIGGLTALISGACYAELCVEFPVSGGSFSYVMITFGEFAGFVTVASLILEYVAGMALVARGFSTYLARLCNQPPDFFRVGPETVAGGQFDLMALAIVLIISAVMTLGMRESALITTYTTVVKVVLLVVVAIVGYTAGSASNMEPFLNPLWEEDGVFLGSSILFFCYVGFDALGTAAEEVKNVNHIPWGIVGSITGAGLLYFMLALAMVLMTTPNISCPYPSFFSGLGRVNFITVFDGVGLHWMQYVTSVAALLGIVAALIVGLFSVSRVVMAASRDWLLPPFLARVSPRTQTPVLAQTVLAVVIAVSGMVVDNNNLQPLVSFGTLMALWLVCNAMLYRRYVPDVQVRATRHGAIETVARSDSHWTMPWRRHLHLSLRARRILVWTHLGVLNAICVALAAFYQANAVVIPDAPIFPPEEECKSGTGEPQHTDGPEWFLIGWALVTLSLQFWCPLEYEPAGWRIPFWMMPWLPSLALLLLVFRQAAARRFLRGLAGHATRVALHRIAVQYLNVAALPNSGYWNIGIFYGGALAFYLVFSLPMSYVKHSRVDYASNEDLK